MKKVFGLLLILGMFAFVACDQGGKKEGEEQKQEESMGTENAATDQEGMAGEPADSAAAAGEGEAMEGGESMDGGHGGGH